MTTSDGKGVTIANTVNDVFQNTELKDNIKVVGTDGTPSMTGPHTGFIRSLELLLLKPVQWSICLLHCNELPLRHVFKYIDGTTSGPDSFNGPIGSSLSSCVSEWPMVRFQRIRNPEFKELPQEVVEDLSTDQYYMLIKCGCL